MTSSPRSTSQSSSQYLTAKAAKPKFTLSGSQVETSSFLGINESRCPAQTKQQLSSTLSTLLYRRSPMAKSPAMDTLRNSLEHVCVCQSTTPHSDQPLTNSLTAQRPRQVGICLKHLSQDPSARFNNTNVPWQRVINSRGVISPRYKSFLFGPPLYHPRGLFSPEVRFHDKHLADFDGLDHTLQDRRIRQLLSGLRESQ